MWEEKVFVAHCIFCWSGFLSCEAVYVGIPEIPVHSVLFIWFFFLWQHKFSFPLKFQFFSVLMCVLSICASYIFNTFFTLNNENPSPSTVFPPSNRDLQRASKEAKDFVFN